MTDLADLLALNLSYLDEADDVVVAASAQIGPGVALTPPLRIDDDVVIDAGAVIGPRVYLEAGARIGLRASVRNAVVLRGAVVDPGETVCERIVMA